MPPYLIAAFLVSGLAAGVALSDARRRQHAELLRGAIAHARLTCDQAAREAEIDPAQFQRQLELIEGSHKRLAMLPDVFWQWYGLLILSTVGLPKEARVARRAAPSIVAHKRMAKARLRLPLALEPKAAQR